MAICSNRPPEGAPGQSVEIFHLRALLGQCARSATRGFSQTNVPKSATRVGGPPGPIFPNQQPWDTHRPICQSQPPGGCSQVNLHKLATRGSSRAICSTNPPGALLGKSTQSGHEGGPHRPICQNYPPGGTV